ncbi:MAG: recombinase family protein [Planctomycetota bacterium]|jgi:site-specific DNA recombinase
MVRKSSNRRLDAAVGYVRRSTDKQEQSISDQKKALEKYTSENGLRLLKFYTDDAISGTSTLGRRAFQQMIKDAQSSERRFDIIVVYDVKRFGRIDNDEAGYYRHILRTNGVEVRYISENFNGDTTDDLLRPVKQWQARQESKDLSKVTIRGLLSKSETGTWMGGVPPYGYDLRYENAEGKFLLILRYMPDGTKQILDKNKKLVFNMYVNQGMGFKSIAYTLNNKNVPAARNSKWSHIYSGTWTDTTLRAILVNPIYSGDMVWNRRTDARFHKISNGQAVDRKDIHGARLVPNDKTDWIVVRDAHPALINRRLFEGVKQQLESRVASIEQRGRDPRVKTHGKTWNGKRNRFILSGLLKCSLCGSRYQGVTRAKGKRRMDGTKIRRYYYGCGGYITKGRKICEMNPIPKEELEEKVIEAVLEFYSPYLQKHGRNMLAEIIKQQTGAEQEDVAGARQRAEDELSRISQIIDNLLDNLNETNREFVDKRLNELSKQRQQLEQRLEELDRLSISQGEVQTMAADAMKFISSLEFTLQKGLPQEKLTVLRQCIERVWINKPKNTMKLAIRLIPVGNFINTQEFKIPI